MTNGLLTQLRTYGQHVEPFMTPFDVKDIEKPRILPEPRRAGSPRRWVYALVAAAAVFAVGLPLLFIRNNEASPLVASNGWVAYSVVGVGYDPILEGPGHGIYVTREGETPRRVAGSDTDGRDQVCPRFSPDGTMLAYTETGGPADTPTIPFDVVVVGFDDGTVGPEILRVESTGDECVSWSPDSTRLAYVIQDPEFTGLEGEYDPFLLKVSTLDGQETTLFDNFGGHKDVEWSPDGSTIGVKGSRDNSYEAVWLVPVDGGSPQELVRAGLSPAQPIVWSPDGSKIALSQWISGEADDGLIRIVSVDGSSEHTIPVSSLYQGESFAWSPDGSRFAYVDHSDERVVTVDSDGSNPVKLHPVELPPGYEGSTIYPGPVWSPDGNSLLVTFGWEGPGAIVSLSLDPEDPPIVIASGLEGITNDEGGASWQAVYP